MHAPAPGRAAATRVARRAAAPQLAYTQLSRGAAPAFCLARSPTPGTSSTAAAIAQAVAMRAAPRHAHLLKNANGSASAHKNTTAASEAARTRTPLRVPAAAACEQDLRQAESNAEILPRCSCCAVKPAPC